MWSIRSLRRFEGIKYLICLRPFLGDWEAAFLCGGILGTVLVVLLGGILGTALFILFSGTLRKALCFDWWDFGTASGCTFGRTTYEYDLERNHLPAPVIGL